MSAKADIFGSATNAVVGGWGSLVGDAGLPEAFADAVVADQGGDLGGEFGVALSGQQFDEIAGPQLAHGDR
jgi:hypothetical protein